MNIYKKHAEMLLKALADNAKGEQIDIKILLPLLKKGKVAYSPILRKWFWTDGMPQLLKERWGILGGYGWEIGGFNIKPSDDWKNSLMECGL